MVEENAALKFNTFMFRSLMGAIAATGLAILRDQTALLIGIKLPSIFEIIYGILAVGIICAAIAVAQQPTTRWYAVSISYLYAWIAVLVMRPQNTQIMAGVSPLIAIITLIAGPLPLVIVSILAIFIGRQIASHRAQRN